MDAVVVSVGGSIFQGKEGPDAGRTLRTAVLLANASTHATVFAVVGGGEVARKYIQVGRDLGENESALDELGILVTRANARLLLSALSSAYPHVPSGFDEAILASKSHKLVVMGGTHPGHTTDAVAAMLAERARAAHLVISTNVRGVYDSDPNTRPDARFLSRVTAEELVKITIQSPQKAGSKGVVDPVAAKIIHRSSLPTLIVDGRQDKHMRLALRTLSNNEFQSVNTLVAALVLERTLKRGIDLGGLQPEDVYSVSPAIKQKYERYLTSLPQDYEVGIRLAYWLYSQELIAFLTKNHFEGTIVEPGKP